MCRTHCALCAVDIYRVQQLENVANRKCGRLNLEEKLIIKRILKMVQVAKEGIHILLKR
jgi:hypothetical protein